MPSASQDFICVACRYARTIRTTPHARSPRTFPPYNSPPTSRHSYTTHIPKHNDASQIEQHEETLHQRATPLRLQYRSRRRFSGQARQSALVQHQLSSDIPISQLLQPVDSSNCIRDRLRTWHDENPEDFEPLSQLFPDDDDSGKSMTLGDSGHSNESVLPLVTGDVDDPQLDAALDELIFRPGALIVGTRDGTSVTYVFIRGQNSWAQLIDETGKVSHRRYALVTFRSNGFVPLHLIDPLLPYLPSEELIDESRAEALDSASEPKRHLPRELVLPLMDLIKEFKNETAALYRKNATALDAAHEILAHEEDLRYGSLSSIATHLFQLQRNIKPSVAQLVAAHHAIFASSNFTWNKADFADTQFVQIHSKKRMRDFAEVAAMVRDWQDQVLHRAGKDSQETTREAEGPITKFLDKARILVRQSRQDRPLTEHDREAGIVPPSKIKRVLTITSDATQEFVTIPFSTTDRKILEFLECHCLTSMFARVPKYRTIAILLIRATGLYDEFGVLDTSTTHMFLQELGVLRPYENSIRRDSILMLPSSGLSKPLTQLTQMLHRQDQEPYHFKDSMAQCRHDWGTLRAYAIDSAQTRRIDDAISIEPAENDGECWVRIHVANPTAFLDREHPIVRLARHLGETIYTPEASTSMLPNNAIEDWWSLASGRPTLTFSARLNLAGEILEHDIRSARINDVVRLDVHDLTASLYPDSEVVTPTIIQIGERDLPAPAVHKVQSLSEDVMADLKKLLKVTSALAQQRKDNGGWNFQKFRPQISLQLAWDKSGIEPEPPYRSSGRYTEGDLKMQFALTPYKNMFEPKPGAASTMVEECMLLCGVISARWCSERQIPGLFRGTRTFVPPEETQRYREEVMDPAIKRNGGVVPQSIGIEFVRQSGKNICQTTSLRHVTLGVDGFHKVTSPLRRYGDMVMHWQIEAALAEQARTGESLITTDTAADRSFLPYSRPALQAFSVGYLAREKIINNVKERCYHMYAAMAIHRMVFHNEGEAVFDKLHFIVVREDRKLGHARGILMEYTIDAFLDEPSLHGMREDLAPDDIWECKVQYIQVPRARIYLTPIRRVSTLEERLDPA